MGTIGKVTAGGATHLVASTAYGTCTTAAATVAKVATIQDSQAFTLLTGVTVHIKMSNSNTAGSPTLNVNSTGAKAIKMYGTTATGTSTSASWYAGSVVSFTYDGTNWIQNDYKVNTNTWNANAVNTSGYVSAPTSSNKNAYWGTDASGNPGWRTMNNYYYKKTNISLSASTWTNGASITVPPGIYIVSGQVQFTDTDGTAHNMRNMLIRNGTSNVIQVRNSDRTPNQLGTYVSACTISEISTTSTLRIEGYSTRACSGCENWICAVQLSPYYTVKQYEP